MSRALRSTAVLTALAVLVLAATQLRAEAHGRYRSAQRYEDVYYLPPPGWLTTFSLGWDEALADIIWMRALVYFGEDMVHGGNVDHVFEYAEAVAALDPSFAAVYRWIGTAGIYRPQSVAAEDVERSVAFMQRGARRFPADGELAWSIGAALAFELVPLLETEAERDEARRRATPWLMTAVRLGAAPEWATLTNASLLERLGRAEQAARHLEEMYLSTDDPTTRRQIQTRIEQLTSQREGAALTAAMDDLRAKRDEDFPYLPLGLYLLVGDRPPIDLGAPMRDGVPRALAARDAPSAPFR